MNDQSAKADGGKLRLTLVPTEAVEAVAAIRMFGVQKYVDEENWKRVEKDRYKDAAFRHYVRYLREPYGMDSESNLPHLWHCLCNLFFLCALEIEDGTLPKPQDAVKKMTRCEPVQLMDNNIVGSGVYIFADELKTPRNGVSMGRLIDADRLAETLERDEEHNADIPQRADGIRDAIMDVMSAPTVDAIEVVRCAVCRYFRCNMRGDGTLPNGVDEFECVLGRGGYDPMDFCSEGERKDGDHDRG